MTLLLLFPSSGGGGGGGMPDALQAPFSGSTINAVRGSDYKARSGTARVVTVADSSSVLYGRLTTIGVENLSFGASRAGRTLPEITGTISAVTQSSGVTSVKIEIESCGTGLPTDTYIYQIQSSQLHDGVYDDFIEVEGELVLSMRSVAPLD